MGIQTYQTIAGKIALMPITAIQLKVERVHEDYVINISAGAENVGDGTVEILDPEVIRDGTTTLEVTSTVTKYVLVTYPDGTTIFIQYDSEHGQTIKIISGTIPFEVGDSFTIIAETTDSLILYNLESESSIVIDPKSRSTHLGNTVTLGYVINATIYIPYNTYNDNGLLAYFSDLTKKHNFVLSVFFGTNTPIGTTYGPIPPIKFPSINSTAGMTMTIPSGVLGLLASIDTPELRQRLKLTMTGFRKEIYDIFT